jgi:membrane-associated phospholipid phosphatase
MASILEKCPFIDEIQYGNPSKEDYHNMTQKSYLDRLLPTLRSYTPPKNSWEKTQKELNTLIEFGKQVNEKTRKTIFDTSLVPYINDLFERNGADPEQVRKTTLQITNDVLPIITKLKYTFQRPRPFQLAKYYQVKLFPDYSYFVSSPSYPSGHTTLAAVICEVLGNHYPEAFDIMRSFVSEVAKSRLLLGVHYPSDNTMAFLTAREIVANPEFRIRYKL